MKKAALVVASAVLLAGSIFAVGAGRRGGVMAARLSTASPTARYVRLDEWARANNFALHWNERDKELDLNGSAKLVFNTDPRTDLRRAGINGVEVWLAFPLIFQNGRPCISESDLALTLAPVLAPGSNAVGGRIKTICLDPGHGGKDPGYRVGSREEKNFTLMLAQELRGQLRAAGFKVVLTRNTDSYVTLDDRTDIAHRNGADLFVSLHFNAVEEGRGDVQGAQTYCCTPAGATSSNAQGEGSTHWVTGNRNDERNMLLAYQVQSSLVKKLPIEDRGAKRARFQVLRDATMPAILIEGGFLSHPSEGRRIADPAYRRQMARAILNGILGYKRISNG